MKKIPFLLLLLFSGYQAVAQTLHALLIADTKDGRIGTSCLKDLTDMNTKLGGVADSIGYLYHPIIVSGQRFGRAALDSVVAQLQCTPQDIVFYHYAGHGYTTQGRPNLFPLMLLKDNTQLGLDEIHLRLKDKKPRLCITLGDCCSELSPIEIPPYVKPLTRGIDTKKDADILAKLFVETQGDILICSTQSGELAGGFPTYGGFYTYAWIDALSQAHGNSDNISWDAFLKDSKTRMESLFNNLFILNPAQKPRQTPHWIINFSKGAPPTPPGPKPVIPFEELNVFLNQLVDESRPYQTRAALRQSKKDLIFQPDAQIMIYMEDPNAPVETQSLTTFLSKLVINAKLIRQVNTIERLSKFNSENGKYQVLTVQQVR